MKKLLPRKFYNRSTLEVARDLLGCYLVRKINHKIIRAKIVDVEAYVGEDDLACHAAKGRTPRSEVLYGQPGHSYVYLIYGMYFIMNLVTEKKDYPAAVMIRAVEIEGKDFQKTNGPGKVCRELNINKSFHNWDVTKGEELWVERGEKISDKLIVADKRIGIAYAQHCADYPWRFHIKRQ